MILYGIITIIIFLIIYVGYYKILYRFWTSQPVFQRYQWYNWAFTNRVINPDRPDKNKYLNLSNIEIKPYDEFDKSNMRGIISLLNQNFIGNKIGENNYKEQTLLPFLTSHNSPSFVGIYKTLSYLHDTKSSSIIHDNRITGIIFSRPLHMTSNKIDTPINFIDTICIDKAHLDSDSEYELIQTLEYKRREKMSNMKISLYKTYNIERCIVPFIKTKTYFFDMRYWHKLIHRLPAGMRVLSINKTSIRLFINFLIEVKKKFECFIVPHITNLYSLISSGSYKVYVILQYKAIVGAYIFKCSNKRFRNKEVIECIGSIMTCEKNVFIWGFVNSLREISKNIGSEGLLISNIAYNNLIIENILLKYKPLFMRDLSYFFYNFIHKCGNENRILIMD